MSQSLFSFITSSATLAMLLASTANTFEAPDCAQNIDKIPKHTNINQN